MCNGCCAAGGVCNWRTCGNSGEERGHCFVFEDEAKYYAEEQSEVDVGAAGKERPVKRATAAVVTVVTVVMVVKDPETVG